MTIATALQIFGPLIVALLALGGTVYNIRSQSKKVEAEAVDKIAAASSSTIDDLMTEIARLNEEIARLNLKAASTLLQMQDLRLSAKRTLELVARLVQGLTVLLDQLHSIGAAPAWIPDPEIDRLIKICVETNGGPSPKPDSTSS
jgi:hypothetical protein